MRTLEHTNDMFLLIYSTRSPTILYEQGRDDTLPIDSDLIPELRW